MVCVPCHGRDRAERRFQDVKMTKKEKETYLKEMKQFTKKVSSSKKKSEKFLKETGIYTPKGTLSKSYK